MMAADFLETFPFYRRNSPQDPCSYFDSFWFIKELPAKYYGAEWRNSEICLLLFKPCLRDRKCQITHNPSESLKSVHAIPQLAECQEILSDARISNLLKTEFECQTGEGDNAEIRLPILIPNVIGMKNALDLGVQEGAAFVSAIEGLR